MLREHYIQNEIRIWCGQHDILCFRCNVGKIRMYDGGWFDTGLPSGFSDLMALDNNGHIYFIECKAPGGKQRPDQVKFMNEVRNRGFTYILAYSVEDVKKVLEKTINTINNI